MDPLLLSRLQFAITVGFHFIFPPITIGLAWLLVIVETLGWKRNNQTYVRMGKFFARILALNFAVGVATGIVMEFQFGTNWAEYSKFVGDIFGAPLATGRSESEVSSPPFSSVLPLEISSAAFRSMRPARSLARSSAC